MRLIHDDSFDWQRPVLTEEFCHNFFLKHGLNSDVSFLSVAWSTIIDKLSYGSDSDKKKCLNVLKKISSLNASGGFSVCQHDKFHLIIPTLKKCGIKTLFAPHMASPEGYTTKDFYFKPSKNDPKDGLYIEGIRIEPAFLWPVFVGENIRNKDIWYSYIGSYGSKHISDIRQKIMDDTHPEDCISISRSGWQFDADVYEEQLLQESKSSLQEYLNRKKSEYYIEVLSRSRFALCPSGTGPAIIRFLEALGSGAIPIVLSDSMMFPNIKGINWDECCLKIKEKDYHSLRDILSKVTKKQESYMRKKGIEYYKMSSGENYAKNIEEYYEQSA